MREEEMKEKQEQERKRNGRKRQTKIWPKIIGCRNGLADRILTLYQDRCKVETEEMEQCLAAIQESSLKGFGTIYEHIFTKHHQESLNTPKVCANSFMS